MDTLNTLIQSFQNAVSICLKGDVTCRIELDEEDELPYIFIETADTDVALRFFEKSHKIDELYDDYFQNTEDLNGYVFALNLKS